MECVQRIPMAFNLFPKSSGKGKPDKAKAGPELAPRYDARQPAARRPASARDHCRERDARRYLGPLRQTPPRKRAIGKSPSRVRPV
jgi:hypothetical protein